MGNCRNIDDCVANSGLGVINHTKTILPIKMKKNKRKEKNTFLNVGLVVIISFSIIFVTYFFVVNTNQTEYFYDFESDVVNSFPAGFVGVGRSTVHTKVVEWDLDDGHDGKVVYISYLDRIFLDEVNYTGIELNTLFNRANDGYVSFDIYLLHRGLGIAIDVCQEDMIWNNTDDICIRIGESTYVSARNEDRALEKVFEKSLTTNTWYRFVVEFNCQKNEWTISIYDKVGLIGNNEFKFNVQPSYLCQLYFATYELGNEFFVDNVRISLGEIIR